MIHARAVEGSFRRWRHAANALLIGVLVGIPWIHIAGEPLVLLDVPARRFHVFGLVIFPQELFFLWLLTIGAALALFFFTALAGRLWCGWACPQTVFTDVFAAIGRFVQGWPGPRPPKHVARWRVALSHTIWFGLSAAIAFHLVGYFVTPYAMLASFADGTVSGVVLGFLVVTTLLSYLDFVVVRQTFCKYLCPYARFQGVLMDRDSLVVGYDRQRGEPRGKRGKVSGDCVDCGLCVQVCPTDIDIREGLQLECIACTQCIDACDGVMEKIGREPGLIAYRSLVGLEGTRPVRLLRPRVLAYAALLVLTAGTFVFSLARREPFDLMVMHNREQLVSRAADGRIGNAFTLRIENRSRESGHFAIGLEGDRDYQLIAGINPIEVAATSSVEARVFVMAPDEGSGRGAQDLRFVLAPVHAPERRLVRATHFIDLGGTDGT